MTTPASTANLHWFLVRVTGPRGNVSRVFVRSTPEALLDNVCFAVDDKVEFKGMGQDAPMFRVPGSSTKFFTMAQRDSYLTGYTGGHHVSLINCGLEDFSQEGRYMAAENAQERMRDREESRRERSNEE